jgi:hypothetical protein
LAERWRHGRWPLAARAQRPTLPVIGFVHTASPQGVAQSLSAFLKGLSEADYVDGHDVAIECRATFAKMYQFVVQKPAA